MSYQLKYRLIMAGLMSFFMAAIMSGCIMALKISPMALEFYSAWLNAFLFAWPIAFPAAFIISPIAQKIANRILPPNPQ